MKENLQIEPMPQPLVDPGELTMIAEMEGWGFVAELVGLFEAQAQQRVAEIAIALGNGDLVTVHSHAHALKSSTGCLGAVRASVLARQLEVAPLDGALADHFACFHACLTDTQRALAMLLQQQRVSAGPEGMSR